MDRFRRAYFLSDLSVVIRRFWVYNEKQNSSGETQIGAEEGMDVNLVLLKKNGSRRILPLPSSVTVIGRRSNCDLHIPLIAVSRRHCQLSRDGGVLKIRDLGSRNGTYLNGKRIDEAAIQPGDHIKVGPLTFVFQIDGQPENVNMLRPGGRQAPQEGTSTEKSTAEGSDSFAELDGLDSLEEPDLI